MNPAKRSIVATAIAIALVLAVAACKGKSGGGSGPPPTSSPGRATVLYASGAVVPGYLVSLAPTASGAVTPLSSIQSPQTSNFAENFLMTFDPSGKLWATSCLGLGNSAGPVVAFSSTANGSSVPPLITIGGAATGLSDCQLGIVVDASGNVYVADNTNAPPQFPGGQVAIFASGQRGNVAPANRIAGTSANFHSPGGLALDAGGNLFVVDTGQGFASFPGDVQVFAPGASGNAAPIRAIAGNNTLLSQPFGIAFDQVGNLYVTNVGSNSITVYAAGAAGNVSPMRVITGPNTRLSLPTGIAVDNAGYAYVGNENQSPPNSPILVFAPNANGNVAPVAATTVNAQRFAEPSGIALR